MKKKMKKKMSKQDFRLRLTEDYIEDMVEDIEDDELDEWSMDMWCSVRDSVRSMQKTLKYGPLGFGRGD